ncbi:carbohydrate kinase [Methylobacterium indicum]|uniref:PfkB family carbohydrate kinase n=1 Tax=Methylobacterium indicum TaxID=1775910 RepID=UPI0007346FDD|nr:PfkB family carbohydrate kinase [Methylobacterium indicum]KTS34674.1 carbohydrate kinase [Methylobacterium indicum]KTS40159.1 carbohydrate kinase [Methylobacterium indicum]KTS53244.1 carbohydrate kinase [Methylobacterium indicum]
MTASNKTASSTAGQGTQPEIVVVGSLHYDITVDAPDRPRKGETVTGRRWAPKFGGKGGNQAAAAQGQGVATAMVGAVGDDDFGRGLLAGLDRAGVDRAAVAILPGTGSGMSVAIFDDGGDYGAVIVSGANLAIEADQIPDARLGQARVLILQNEIPEAVNAAVARRARQLGLTTILNAAPARPFATDLPDHVDILVVNAIEAEMLGGGSVESLAQAATAAETLSARFGLVVVTAGGDGVAMAGASIDPVALPALPITVVSTHGAGDMFVGTFAARLARGDAPETALRAANAAAARLVSTPEHERAAL